MTLDKNTENQEARRASDKKIIELEQDHVKIQAQLEKIDNEITTLIRTMAKEEVNRIERFQGELRRLERLFNEFKDEANTIHNNMTADMKNELTKTVAGHSRNVNLVLTFILAVLAVIGGVIGVAYDKVHSDIEKNYRVLSKDDARDYKFLNDEISANSDAILVLTEFMSTHQEIYIPVGKPKSE